MIKLSKQILKSEKGIGLIVSILVLGLIITVFIGNISRLYLTLSETNQKVLRGIAAIQVMQDFGVAALQANDISSRGPCPVGTAQIGTPGVNGFCWPTPQLCVQDPRQNLAGTRQLCLNPTVATGQAELAMTVKTLEEPSFFARVKYQSYEMLRWLLNASANEAVAQVGRDLDLPNIAGNPVNSVTTVLTCTNATAGSQLCKRCVGSGGTPQYNVVCSRVRVCLMIGAACAAGVTDNWVYERFGISRQLGP